MIIQLDGPSASTAAAQHALRDLARNWDPDLTAALAEATEAGTGTGRDHLGKAIDPVSLASLALSIPSAALAVLDLADRIRKRRRASELIDHARQLAGQQVTLTLITRTRTAELTTLTPDQLLDLIATDHDNDS